MDYQVEKMLVLSTAHIDKDVYDYLEQKCLPKHGVYSFGTGWRVLVDRVTGGLYGGSGFEDLFGPYLGPSPQSLKDCASVADRLGCKWLLLDASGPIKKWLPKYEFSG